MSDCVVRLKAIRSVVRVLGGNVLFFERAQGEDVEKVNIELYKMQDYVDVAQNGGELPTDEEYAAAEAQLQVLYKRIMEGDNE